MIATFYNEKQAWVAIRDAFQEFADTGACQLISDKGICNAIRELYIEGHIPLSLMYDMRTTLRRFNPHPGNGDLVIYWFECDQKGAKQRVELVNRIIESFK